MENSKLGKFQDSFANNSTTCKLGQCSLIKHKIDNGRAEPISKPMTRTPLGFEAEEENTSTNRLNQDPSPRISMCLDCLSSV